MNTTKLNRKRIVTIVIVAFILALSLTVCAACGYIVVSLKEISATYSGDAIEVGGIIDKNDIVVTAKYSNNTSKVVTNYELSYDFSAAGQRLVTVSYGYAGQSRNATFYVTVVEKSVDPEPVKALESITAVYNGQNLKVNGSFNKDDIVVTAAYSDNTSKQVADYQVSNLDTATAGQKTITITYSENGVTKTCELTLTVEEDKRPDPPTPIVTLKNITALYKGQDVKVGETINKLDIEVTAYYSDDSSRAVTDYSVSELDTTTAGQKTITVTYVEDDITKTCEVTVTVVEDKQPDPPTPVVVLEKITAVYNGANIKVNGTLNNDDIVVTAYYSDESSKTVVNFAVGGFSSAKAGTCAITVSYTENGVTQECTLNITITEDSHEVIANSNLSIHFLELGNQYTGDCVYIKAGDTDILIDAGSRKNSASTLIKYIDNFVTDGKLEYVIATHEHQDHISGFMGLSGQKGIFEQYVCENIIDFSQYNSSLTTASGADSLLAEYFAARDAEIAAGANHYTALDCVNNANGAQKIYDLTGDGSITMEILNQRYYSEKSSDPNNYSVCVMISQKVSDTQTNNYLFTGDLEKSGEDSLVKLNPNLPKMKLFKGGHHGSYTASNDVLLEKIAPEYVCICCCAGNVEYTQNLDNTFPAQAMIDRIAKYTDNVYVTTLGKIKENGTNSDGSIKWANDGYESMNGNIVFSCIDGVITLNCSNNNLKLKDTQWFKDNRRCPIEWEQPND